MINADKFWETYNKTEKSRVHICDIPEEIFYARHKNVLKLITEQGYPADEIGLFIAGKYYSDVWNSRSCSGYLAYLLGISDNDGGAYMTFYCSSSSYFYSKNGLNDAYISFIKADELDNRMG
jgi:hypothetical protein